MAKQNISFFIYLHVIHVLHFISSQTERQLGLRFKQQIFHPFCCGVVGFVQESSSTSLYILHVCLSA